MRNTLPRKAGVPEHLALAYNAWAPVGTGGKVPDDQRDEWLAKLAELAVAPDYKAFYSRWKSSFRPPGDLLARLTLTGRLLVGHGDASATDVGITVHHTWGVPMVPGSALKGLLAHYVDAVYGPDDPSVAPWSQPQADRAPFQGVSWRGRRIQRGPGEVYRALFGAPDAEEDSAAREVGYAAGATSGLVVFHDALYVPGSAKEDRPFAADVLTVHQKTYYDGTGATWPNDHDDPNPVPFVTVRPKTQFLLVLSGPEEWTNLAGALLRDALAEWGVGSKTSAGYGIGKVDRWQAPTPPRPPASEALERFLTWLAQPPRQPDGSEMTQRQILAEIEARWIDELTSLTEAERSRAARELGRKITSKKLVDLRDQVIRRVTEKST